jgi:4-hydroxy-3-methylbut-2-enyl diphosphate reductase
MADLAKPTLELLIAAPRGFCAGVDRAIRIVELAIEKYGAPVYVRHEIVHNKYVVDTLKSKGAIFVEELDQVPDDVPVVFSAHGVPKAVPAKAEERGLLSRRHLPARLQGPSPGRAAGQRRAAHPVHRPCRPSRGDRHFRPGARRRDDLVETPADAEAAVVSDPENLAFLTQTTLSVDDTAATLAVLKRRFPGDPRARRRRHLLRHHQPPGAVKAIASSVDLVLVIGGQNSSNSTAPRRSRRAPGHHRLSDPARRGYRLRLVRGRRHRRADRRALRHPSCWYASSSTSSPSASR